MFGMIDGELYGRSKTVLLYEYFKEIPILAGAYIDNGKGRVLE